MVTFDKDKVICDIIRKAFPVRNGIPGAMPHGAGLKNRQRWHRELIRLQIRRLRWIRSGKEVDKF